MSLITLIGVATSSILACVAVAIICFHIGRNRGIRSSVKASTVVNAPDMRTAQANLTRNEAYGMVEAPSGENMTSNEASDTVALPTQRHQYEYITPI